MMEPNMSVKPPPCFDIHKLKKAYSGSNSTPVLDIDRLTIYQGEITAVLGYSAAGKSTLLNILGLLDELKDCDQSKGEEPSLSSVVYHHSTGDRFQYSRISCRIKRRLRKRAFGFIFQNHYLASHLNVRDNITLPLMLKAAPVHEEVLSELLCKGGFKTKDMDHSRSLPFSLSGGQSLRVSVLRALAHRPRVLFADEPTGSLDPVTGDSIMHLINDWHQSDPANTTILVTHNFHQAWKYAQRFLIMRAGRIVFDGRKGESVHSPDDLFNSI